MPLQWPGEYIELRDKAKVQWEVFGDIELIREYGEGLSGARVFLVELESRIHRGAGILKLDTPRKWDGESSESERHQSAIQTSPAFAQEHLAQLLGVCEFNNQTAVLSSVAGDLSYTQPLIRVDLERQCRAIRQVASGVLREWNTAYEMDSCVHNPLEPLGAWLGYRLSPKGQLYSFLEDACKLSPSDPAFCVGAKWFPNPFAFASQSDLWPQGLECRFIKGRCHGDLHGNNILIRTDEKDSVSYYLIDLSLYSCNSYLFYDHAYLEISYILNHRKGSSIDQFLQLLSCLNEHSNHLQPDDRGIVEVLSIARDEVAKWIDSAEPGRVDWAHGQVLLARVAAGLNFANKAQLDDQQRKLAFIYAAHSMASFLERFRVKWIPNGRVLAYDQVVPKPTSEMWREVWNSCDGFDHKKNVYGLVAGTHLRSISPSLLSVLGRVAWAFVIDLDPDTEERGLHSAMAPTLQRHRAPRISVADNIPDINFREATCWFKASKEDSSRIQTWRHQTIPAIRTMAQRVVSVFAPQPVTVLFLAEGLNDSVLRAIWTGLDEVLQGAGRYVVVGSDPKAELFDDAEEVTLHRCEDHELIAGLWSVYGVEIPERTVVLPGRQGPVTPTERDMAYFNEDLEIVHAGSIESVPEDAQIGLDFWRGHRVTWAELDMQADVSREVTKRLSEELRSRLEESRVFSITLCHTPGAGGTTVARRLAWDFKDEYPTVLVHHISQGTVGRLEQLYHLTKLPILAVLESGDVPEPVRERLLTGLKDKNVRIVMLYVVQSPNAHGPFLLREPLGAKESRRFYERYRTLADSDRASVLRRLTFSDDMLRYRSPFFYGLYTFEKDFVHVADFVSAHLKDLTERTHKLLCYLALVTRFSQSALRDSEVRQLMDLALDLPLRLEEIVGEAPARLILHREQQMRILHPMIAEELLKRLIGEEDWNSRLTDIACEFIHDLTSISGAQNENTLRVLSQMFIAREFWDDAERRKNFSELMLTIPNSEGQHRVLRALVEHCPDYAHFWNHLGRHHIYRMDSPYQLAEDCLLKAIDLDGENHIHHHGLGMVYRFAVRKRLKDAFDADSSVQEACESVVGLVSQAEDCFAEARRWNPDGEHGFITHIQLITECIERLYSLSGATSYAQFLTSPTPAAAWCRQELSQAEELLRQVKANQAEDSISHFTTMCDARLQRVYGHVDTMVSSLQKLLDKTGVQKGPIRRAMANAILSDRQRSWSSMRTQELLRVHQLMTGNLDENPNNVHDLLMWFQAYRRLRTFDMMEAIDRLNRWAIREGSAQAHYYLYVLHFLRWRQGLVDDDRRVHEHLKKCKLLAPTTGRTRSFEWLARTPLWCPLVHQSELGQWSKDENFYSNITPLALVDGTVTKIFGGQAGTIGVGNFEVFFVPGTEFREQQDENARVQFYLGFSYDGMRAWRVKRVVTQ